MRILIADDHTAQAQDLQQLLESWGYSAAVVVDGAEALDVVREFRPHVLLTEMSLPTVSGMEIIQKLHRDGMLPPTILLSSAEDARRAVLGQSAYWFLEKPVDAEVLRILLPRAAEQGRLATENECLRLELSHHGVLAELVGMSPQMQLVFSQIRQIAPTESHVLIQGEKGTGKELAGRAVHQLSNRAQESFVAVNCATLPGELLQSELFGHERGGSPSALDRRAGALELAQGGVLFLDEIGAMPPNVQYALLRALGESRFRRVRGTEEIPFDVRLIVATTRGPDELTREGKLMEAFYAQLNPTALEMPPLSQRPDDIPLIAMALIERLNQKHGTRVTHLDPDAASALQDAVREGNIRELRNEIESALLLAREGPLRLHHLAGQGQSPEVALNGLGISIGMTVAEGEQTLIEATLVRMKNNKTRAAKTLGISTKTLHAKIKQYRGGAGEPHAVRSESSGVSPRN